MRELSKMQQQIYDYIRESLEKNGYPPSVREIGEAVGLRSPSTVHFHLKNLEEADLQDDTVIVIATDHYPYGLERSGTWNNTSDYLRELYGVEEYDHFRRDSNALIIWSGCLEDQDIVVEEPVYSLDILPTLSNLFGVEYDSRLLVGRDVFSDAEPIVLWPDYSWKTDKGTYNAKTETFTPVEGIAVPDGYVEYISSQVANKITYSDSVLKTDYFNYLVKALTGEE